MHRSLESFVGLGASRFNEDGSAMDEFGMALWLPNTRRRAQSRTLAGTTDLPPEHLDDVGRSVIGSDKQIDLLCEFVGYVYFGHLGYVPGIRR
jgi:hypothetical protein